MINLHPFIKRSLSSPAFSFSKRNFMFFNDKIVDSKKLLHRPEAIKIIWLKDSVRKVLPFTIDIITSKGESMETLSLAVSYCPQKPPVYEGENSIGMRRIDDSWLEVILPFSDHAGLRGAMAKSNGKTIRYGKLFEILDSVAADVAYRHCSTNENEELTIVTASVDGLEIISPIDLTQNLKLQSYLTYVGKSSMEINIDLMTVNENGDSEFKGSTKFIMVARSEGKAKKIHGLLAANDEARQCFVQGEQRTAVRRIRAATSLNFMPPRSDEVDLIHSLYLESKRIEESKEFVAIAKQHIHQPESISLTSPSAGNSVALSETQYVWTKNTSFKNTQFMHLQNRNIHGKIFGGYIMRTAFELAWVCSACFIGVDNLVFIYVDDIQFVKPVNIGSIIEFTSNVIYSHNNYIVIQVAAVDVSPVNHTRTTTNIMKYIFKARDGSGLNLPHIMPSTYEEIVLYLEGKRALDQFLAHSDDAIAQILECKVPARNHEETTNETK